MKWFGRKYEEDEDEFFDWEHPLPDKKNSDNHELYKIIAAALIFCVVYGVKDTQTSIGTLINGGVQRVVEEHTDFSGLYERMQAYVPEEWSGRFMENVQNVLARPANPLFYLNAPSEAEIVTCFGAEPIDKGIKQNGIEYRNGFGDFVRAASMGKVKKVAKDDAMGLFVLIEHGQNLESLYGYLGEALVKEGDRIQRGQVIARSGERPRDKEPLFYFELRENGVPVNPEARLKNGVFAQGGSE